MQIGEHDPGFRKFGGLARDELQLGLGIGIALLSQQHAGIGQAQLGRMILFKIALDQRLHFGGTRFQQLHGQQGDGTRIRTELGAVLQRLQGGGLLAGDQAHMAYGGPGHGAVLRVLEVDFQRLLDHIGGQRLVRGIVVELGDGQKSGASIGLRGQLDLSTQIAARVCDAVHHHQNAQHGAVGIA